VHRFGDAPRIDLIEAPEAPGPHELLVDVAAMGVGAWDVGIAAGRLAELLPGVALPFTMGAELAGRVRAVGAGVEGFDVGDRVMANPGVVGAWADRLRLPASVCGRAPTRADDLVAATLPVRGLTAWQSLERLDLAAGSQLLVVGAGGAVGRATVEMACRRGLRVLAIAGERALDPLRRLGAELVLDHRSPWPERLASDVARPVDGLLDLVGGDALVAGLGFVRAGGGVVSTVPRRAPADTSPGIRFAFLKMKSTRGDLESIAELVDLGRLTTRIAQTFPLEEAPLALRAIRSPGGEPGELALRASAAR
jgi:NADPH:quinone reductase-like Zn-dependent oxidoreductase